MLDMQLIRSNPEYVQERLSYRGYNIDVHTDLLALDSDARVLSSQADRLRERRNQISGGLSNHFNGSELLDDERVSNLQTEAVELRSTIRTAEDRRKVATQSLMDVMLGMPNIPADHTPPGLNYDDFKITHIFGEKPIIDTPTDHSEIGRRLGILDTEAGMRLAGPRFSVLKGQGAVLQRALVNYFLDHNTDRGYEERVVPYMVNATSLQGTGQLPKFEQDVFVTEAGEGRTLYLSPTTEVQLTNLARGKVFTESELPYGLTGYSENFRSEAGSAGRDTTGILRQHQFPKVELVRFSTPESSWESFEQLTNDAESALQNLGIHYRKVALAAGDIAFQSAFTYDLEAYFPGQDTYREVSSCSNCTDFQARRIGAQVLSGTSGEKTFAHTSNGSSLAVGRTIAVLLEQGLQPDGSVIIPEALQDYTKFDRIKN